MTQGDTDPPTTSGHVVPTEEAIASHLLSEIHRVASGPGAGERFAPPMPRTIAHDAALPNDAQRADDRLHELSELDHSAFVDRAFRILLKREPTADERWESTARLLRGEPKTAVLGRLRFSPEGRARGVEVPGLRPRHLAQRLFRIPLLGYVLEWANALVKLPVALRFGRVTEQRFAAALASLESRLAGERAERLASGTAEVDARAAQQATVGRIAEELKTFGSRLAEAGIEASARAGVVDAAIEAHAAALADLARSHREGQTEVDRLRLESDGTRSRIVALDADLRGRVGMAESKLERLLPGSIPGTLELRDEPFASAQGRTAAGISDDVSNDSWYADFERVFYRSTVVAEKQRIYLPYIDRALASRLPVLDLGCGRGEFMEILRGEGIRSVGVDLSSVNVEALRASGHTVHAGDLIDFLERDRGTYAGAVALQVVEHLPPESLARALALLQARLAPGAVLVIESVNPHCPYALGNFHMDPTHVAPVPPDRVRFTMERAGFVRTATLYQAPIPGFAFGGPEARAHYTDYAVIGYRD